MTREIAFVPDAMTIHCELRVAGALCRVATNSHTVEQALQMWRGGDGRLPAGEFSMQVLVTDKAGEGRGNPYFRGLRHLVIASFGAANMFVFDLARRNVLAAVSEELAGDQLFWDRLLLPIAMGILGAAVGVVPVHCACLAIDGAGLLIAGASGAGKSTLSVALAKSGFTFLSDDWTYLSQSGDQLTAHGMSVPAKLLPDCERFFPFLAGYPIRPALNQELAFELPPQDLATQVELYCQPRWFFFLERGTADGCRLDPVSPHEARQYVELSVERLPPELTDIARRRAAIMAEIPRLSCWKLTYGGPPAVAVQGLQQFIAQQPVEVPA
jgi:hypothetical protein